MAALVQQRREEGFALAYGGKADPMAKLQFEEKLMN